MARKAIGEVRRTSHGFVSVVRLNNGKRRTFRLSACRDENEARARSATVAEIAARLRHAGVLGSARSIKLLELAAEVPDSAIGNVLQVVQEQIGGELVDLETPTGPTFESVAKEWFDGTMRKRFPDNVEKVSDRYLEETARRLRNGVFRVIGSRPIASITRADCDDVMRQLPVPKGKDELSRETRRQYAVAINRVLNLAELAGYIDRNPLPRGWLPRSGAQKRFPILYPTEDTTFLACIEVSLCMRLFYGVLHREGVRRSEAATLQVKDLDLEHGTIALDENKTDHPRWWKLSPGVAEALKRWLDDRDAGPDDFVFVDESGATLDLSHMATKLRGHLKAAGVTRADLTSRGPNKGQFGVHCFRRSFVTRNLALGRNEDWVRQRTGHKSDELLRYRQGAKALAELDLGEVLPLNEAIPELRDVKSERGEPPGSGERNATRNATPCVPAASLDRSATADLPDFSLLSRSSCDWGSGGPGFKSRRPDHLERDPTLVASQPLLARSERRI